MVKACDAFCDGCIYRGFLEGNLRCCNYLLHTDQMRPCPPGKGCTVKKTDKRTPEQKKADAQWRKKLLREKERQKRMRTVFCENCGKKFRTTHKQQKNCSPECSRESTKRRQLRYLERKKGGGVIVQ